MESLVIGVMSNDKTLGVYASLKKQGTIGVMLGFVIMMFLDKA
ncbi:hypothetical protein NIES2100_50400 [Calothrix sp. NIES-2100]|nr:hypothetical protein NIES2100_50400 [Calothrix sp. NIES-2100]